MWIPDRFEMPSDEVLDHLGMMGAADLITPGPEGLSVTFLPWVFDETVGEHGVLRSHIARQNPHWELLAATDAESLLIWHGEDFYVAPAWFPSRLENPRVVPTWNYQVIHLHGHVRVHTDADWILRQITEQSDKFEEFLPEPWSVDQAPADFIEGMARAIVGLEFVIDRIEAKSKMSQNKSPEDVEGIARGLEATGAQGAAGVLREANRGKQWPPLRTKYQSQD